MPPAKKSFTSDTGTPQANPLEGVTFELDGVEFKCEGHMSFLDTSDMARKMAELPTTELDDLRKMDPMLAAQAMGTMSASLLMALGDAEYRRFKTHCHQHRTADEVIAEVMGYINEQVEAAVEREAARPTQPPQPSSNGPAETDGRTSRIVSLQHGDVTVIGQDGQEQPVMRGHQEVPRQPAPSTIKTLGEDTPPKRAGRRHTA